MPNVAVRLATLADLDAAIAVWQASSATRHGGQPAPAEHEARVRRWARQPDTFLIVADGGGAVVAMGLAMQGRAVGGAGPPGRDFCFISMIYVVPDRWGAGLGGKVVDAVLEEARARGYRRAVLWTAADNIRAQRLYEGRGFQRSGQEQVGEWGKMEVQYERVL